MIKRYELKKMTGDELQTLMLRSRQDIRDVKDGVKKIIKYVKSSGDEALRHYTEVFDGVKVKDILVSAGEISEAYELVDDDVVSSIKRQIYYSTEFHKRQLKDGWKAEVEEGIIVGERYTPIESVGLYVPGGRAAYPTVLQILSVPAKLAEVPRIVVCTPPSKDGKIPAPVLVAADILGITEIYKVGGAQAIAALAYGTETISPVKKIAGPGNVYVNTAKLEVIGTADIDMVAGPSEVLILADDTASPRSIAADFMARCEHDPNAAAVLITDSDKLATEVIAEIEKQLPDMARKDIIIQALSRYSAIITSPNWDECLAFVNDYASEHLQIMTSDPWQVLPKITNAGSIFLGEYAPVAIGDYASGTNHVLPTGQFSKMYSPVGVDTFQKRSEFQYLSKEGLKKLEPIVRNISKVEGLEAHYHSVEVRLNESRV